MNIEYYIGPDPEKEIIGCICDILSNNLKRLEKQFLDRLTCNFKEYNIRHIETDKGMLVVFGVRYEKLVNKKTVLFKISCEIEEKINFQIESFKLSLIEDVLNENGEIYCTKCPVINCKTIDDVFDMIEVLME